jgi:hypothetical protein
MKNKLNPIGRKNIKKISILKRDINSAMFYETLSNTASPACFEPSAG